MLIIIQQLRLVLILYLLGAKNDMKKNLLSSTTLLLLSTLAFGQVPNTFSSGETISSSKINANFSFLANAMGSGNITAMMHCGGEVGVVDMDNLVNDVGEVYTNPQVAYSNCLSTDNT